MSDLIRKSKILNYIKGLINPYGKPFKGTSYELGVKLMEYIEQVDDEESVTDTNVGCKWILCNQNLPEGCDDAELEVLVYTEEKYIEAEFKEVGFALYYPGEKKFRSVYNHRADITENVVAWMQLPRPYKGE